MGRIYVCPHAYADSLVAETGAERMISFFSPGREPARPDGIESSCYFPLCVSDIVVPLDLHRLATPADIQLLLDLGSQWRRERPLLISCFAGVSRSPAAAYILSCALSQRDPTEVALTLRQAAPSATPNPHFIALADRLLSCNGTMINAISAIGRGAECREGAPFFLEA